MPVAPRSDITLSAAPLGDAEDRLVQMELPAFGLPEHRAEGHCQLVARQHTYLAEEYMSSSVTTVRPQLGGS
jgi:hypothetical protein